MILLLLLLLLLPFGGNSQYVKANSFDKFLMMQRLEVSPVTIYSSAQAKVNLSYTAYGPNLFIQISGWGWGATTIDKGDELIFLFSNDSVVTVRAAGLQTFDPTVQRNSYKHQYYIKPDDLQLLSKYELVGIRKFYFNEYTDIEVAKEYRSNVQKVSALFAAEIDKNKLVKTIKTVNVKDVPQFVGDSVMFCSKIYNARYFDSSEQHPTVLDVQADFSDPEIKIVIPGDSRSVFGKEPEKLLLNKEVCISGQITLQNNIPCIFIRKREQIKVQSRPTLQEVDLFVGDTVTLSGRVFTTRFVEELPNQPTFLNLGAPYPDQSLTVIIGNKFRSQFREKPEIFYLDKEIQVSGKVVLYGNEPAIIVQSFNQVKVLNDYSKHAAYTAVSNQTPQKQAMQNDLEIPAEFPGGDQAFITFLNNNLECPENLEQNEVKKVIASFYVDTDGSIQDIRIKQSAGREYDAEVIRVLRKMPRWQPKAQSGKLTTGFTISIPVTFRRI